MTITRALAVVATIAAILHLELDAAAAPIPERHVRLRTTHGPVHVWTPAGYDRQTAALVIFVHGYFADVDDAWRSYHLRDQFRASKLNAMFVACGAPLSDDDVVDWTSLSELLDVVARRAGPLPGGRVIAMGHSGAHRTLSEWLDDPELDAIALIDAAYGDLDPYAQWLHAQPDRRLLDVGALLLPATDDFHAHLPETVVVDHFPSPAHGTLPDKALSARVVYVRSRMSHMELVTKGIAIPMLLRALQAPLLSDADRHEPLAAAKTL